MKHEMILAATREALQEIASTMLFIEIEAGESRHQRTTIQADVSSIVGLSNALDGSVRLAGPMLSVLKLASALIGDEVPEMNSDAKDGFAELCNMVAGGIQTRLSSTLGEINLTPPVVVSGENHKVNGESKEACVSQDMATDNAKFFVEVFFMP